MEKQKKSPNEMSDMGSKLERKRQRALQKFVEEVAGNTAKKYSKKQYKRIQREVKKTNKRVDGLEKTISRSSEPDRDENGFYQLKWRKK